MLVCLYHRFCTEAAEQVYRTYRSCSVNSVQDCMLIKPINMYQVFPAFVSTPDSLLVTNTLSVFNFIVFRFAHIRSWCVPLSFTSEAGVSHSVSHQKLVCPTQFQAPPVCTHSLTVYSPSKLKSNVDKASLFPGYSKRMYQINVKLLV
jgi:hypothetical protein